MSSPPKGWVGFGALKSVEKGKRERNQEDTQTQAPQTQVPETSPPPQTQVPETQAPQTQVPETRVDLADPRATSAPQTQVYLTPVPETPVPRTQVHETSQLREPGQPSSLSGALPQTQVHETQAPKTRVRKTQVPGTQVATFSEARKDGYTRLDNWVVDDFLPRLDPYEQIVFLRLYRLTVGFNRTTCVVSHEKLAEKANLSLSTVKRVCNRLVALGHIASRPILGGSRAERGCEFEMLAPVTPPGGRQNETKLSQTQVPETQATGTQVPESHMKEEHERKHEKPMYEIRRAAARLKEAHRNDSSYNREQLIAEVRAGFVMQGREISDSEIEEALKGLAL
jgi:hypothetical protein